MLSRLLPKIVAAILSDSLRRERVLLERDASDVLRDAFYQTEASMNNYYEVFSLLCFFPIFSCHLFLLVTFCICNWSPCRMCYISDWYYIIYSVSVLCSVVFRQFTGLLLLSNCIMTPLCWRNFAIVTVFVSSIFW